MNNKNETNEVWDLIFKATQIAVPVFIAVATVVVVPWCRGIESRLIDLADNDNNVSGRVIKLEEFAAQGDRFTATQAAKMKLELQNEWLKELSLLRRQIDQLPQTLQMPPIWWEQYVRTEIQRVNARVDVIEGKPKQ